MSTAGESWLPRGKGRNRTRRNAITDDHGSEQLGRELLKSVGGTVQKFLTALYGDCFFFLFSSQRHFLLPLVAKMGLG